MTIEQVLETVKEVNLRPVKIAESAYENVYNRRSEWYGKESTDFHYAPIQEMIYTPNVIPLKKEVPRDSGKA